MLFIKKAHYFATLSFDLLAQKRVSPDYAVLLILVPGKNYPETGIKNIYGKTPAIV